MNSNTTTAIVNDMSSSLWVPTCRLDTSGVDFDGYALSEYKMTKDGASYNAAQAAYYVAYQEYSEEISETTKIWEDYVNQLSRNATIEIYV